MDTGVPLVVDNGTGVRLRIDHGRKVLILRFFPVRQGWIRGLELPRTWCASFVLLDKWQDLLSDR